MPTFGIAEIAILVAVVLIGFIGFLAVQIGIPLIVKTIKHAWRE